MQAIRRERAYELTVKKSKFLAVCFLVNSEKQAADIIKRIKTEHAQAKHVVYAYRLLANGQIKERLHNDREPAQSAGLPLYNLLKTKDIINCLIVVVRYYGGIKLGVGGLVRAYTQAAQLVLQDNLFENKS